MKNAYVCLLALCIFVMPASAFAQNEAPGSPPVSGVLQRVVTAVFGTGSGGNDTQEPCPNRPAPAIPLDGLTLAGVPAPSAPALVSVPNRADVQQARRVRARGACEPETESAMREACYRCYERGGHIWIRYGSSELAGAAATAAEDQGLTLAQYRCQAAHAVSSHRAVTALAVRVRELERNQDGASAMRTDLNRLLRTQGAIEPRIMSWLISLALGDAARQYREREIAVQEGLLAACVTGRPRVAASLADQGLPEAPSTMVLWPDDEVRARGFRPRHAVTAGQPPQCTAIRDHVRALRTELGAQIQEGALPAPPQLAAAYQLVAHAMSACAHESASCDQARAALERFVQTPRPDVVSRNREVATAP